MPDLDLADVDLLLRDAMALSRRILLMREEVGDALYRHDPHAASSMALDDLEMAEGHLAHAEACLRGLRGL